MTRSTQKALNVAYLMFSLTLPGALCAAQISPSSPCPSSAAPTQGVRESWALLIGINRYKNSRTQVPTSTFNDLNGSENDVMSMSQILRDNFQFKDDHICTLKSENATRDGILGAIQQHLIGKAKDGDVVVIHYSGHGSQVPNPDLPNGADGTIVPYDARMQGAFDITGNELSEYLRRIRTKDVTVILDSCYTGDLIRSRSLSAVRTIPPDPRQRPDIPVSPAGSRGVRKVDMLANGGSFALITAGSSIEEANEALLERRQ